MTPILWGRWQTRLFLMIVFGIPITLIFGVLYADFQTPLTLIIYVIILGLIWDILYNWLQTLRWDNDWPPAVHFLTGITELLTVWLLTRLVAVPGVSSTLTFAQFFAHYTTVWLVTFSIMWGPMKVIFPHWRFRGGRII